MNLASYFGRIGLGSAFLQQQEKPENASLSSNHLSQLPPANLETLTRIMAAHSRSICFENCDVVLGKVVSMKPNDVEHKLVHHNRGGYCFEQNTLLKMALQQLGYSVTPFLCRVLWSRPDTNYDLPPQSTFTHMALKVWIDAENGDGEICGGSYYLADVGFAGTNSIAPVKMGHPEPLCLPEGQFRITEGRPGYDVLQLLVSAKNSDAAVAAANQKSATNINQDENEQGWRSLYTWRQGEDAALVDLECANWFSCTFPTARFVTSFFISRIIWRDGTDERHHIENDTYVIRKGHGDSSVVERQKVQDKAQLLHFLDTVFGVQFSGGTEGLDRFLYLSI
ncbi:hypothetical protein ACA910_022066 [Epithemia clementina (nom. ined.)]